MFDKATEMYIQGGEVEQVEQISTRKEHRFQRTYSAQQLYDDAETAYHGGQRDKAHHLLKQCLALDPDLVKARSLFDKLTRAFQAGAKRRIYISGEEQEYLLFAKQAITLGRQEDNDIVLNQHDVSRHHARLGFQGERCLVEDLGSSNGTRLNGLRIQKTASIHSQDALGFGLNLLFEAKLYQHQEGIALTLQAPGTSRHYLVFHEELRVGYSEDCAFRLPQLPLALSGCLFKVKYQPPYWYWTIHPQLKHVELNGSPVEHSIVVIAGDALRFAATTMLFE
jgi:hypothetical protein